MVIVKFNSVDEFLDELRKTRIAGFCPQPQVWPPIVRLTYLRKQSSMSPNVSHLFVVGTFAVTAWLAPDNTSETIVRLDTFCGDTWGLNSDSDNKVQERAEAITKQIEDACKELGYEVRAGVYEEAVHGQSS